VFVAVLLLPSDPQRQAELAAHARSGVERAATFCERNPATCAAGRDLWASFVRKAEFGLDLASRLARNAVAQNEASRDVEPLRQPHRSAAAPARGTLSPGEVGTEWRRPARSSY
jgi:hypothetical protein